ncbi:MAG: hypothetical protein AAF939_18010, partial [Planctomycetota bacterium]
YPVEPRVLYDQILARSPLSWQPMFIEFLIAICLKSSKKPKSQSFTCRRLIPIEPQTDDAVRLGVTNPQTSSERRSILFLTVVLCLVLCLPQNPGKMTGKEPFLGL